MTAFTLGLVFVIVIPLAEGVLVALLLRELCNRPALALPLGGRIVPMWWRRSEPVSSATAYVVDVVHAPSDVAVTDSIPDDLVALISPSDSPPTVLPIADSDAKPNLPWGSGTSVFDGTQNIPKDLLVGNVLDAMIMETPAANLHDLERIIEASAQTNDAVSKIGSASTDDMNLDDLQALAEALPGTKINFSQEIDHEESSEMHSMEKELLGEHFDIEALKQQSQQVGAILAAETLLDVREDVSSGTVQVSSPFISKVGQQFTDVTVPQTVLSMFSDNWVQETGGVTGTSQEDATKFCFTEESSPLVMRKKKKQG